MLKLLNRAAEGIRGLYLCLNFFPWHFLLSLGLDLLIKAFDMPSHVTPKIKIDGVFVNEEKFKALHLCWSNAE